MFVIRKKIGIGTGFNKSVGVGFFCQFHESFYEIG